MAVNTPHPEVDPLEHTALHTILVKTNQLQSIPASVVALIITFNALLVWLIWLPQGISGAGVFMAYVLLIGLNWFLLSCCCWLFCFRLVILSCPNKDNIMSYYYLKRL